MLQFLRKFLAAVGLGEPVSKGDAERSILDEVRDAAPWVANCLNISRYRADFSLESLREIDRFFDDQAPGGEAKPGGLLAQDINIRVFALGAYIGEVLRRNAGGQWIGDDTDPQAGFNVTLKLKGGVLIWPVQRAFKRLHNEGGHGVWAEDSIYHYGLMTLGKLATASDGGKDAMRPP